MAKFDQNDSGVVVIVLDAHKPVQTSQLVKLAQIQGSSSIPPPLPYERISRSPTIVESEETLESEDVDGFEDED